MLSVGFEHTIPERPQTYNSDRTEQFIYTYNYSVQQHTCNKTSNIHITGIQLREMIFSHYRESFEMSKASRIGHPTGRKHLIGLRYHDVYWQQHNYVKAIRQITPELSLFPLELIHFLRTSFAGALFDKATIVSTHQPYVLPFPNL